MHRISFKTAKKMIKKEYPQATIQKLGNNKIRIWFNKQSKPYDYKISNYIHLLNRVTKQNYDYKNNRIDDKIKKLKAEINGADIVKTPWGETKRVNKEKLKNELKMLIDKKENTIFLED